MKKWLLCKWQSIKAYLSLWFIDASVEYFLSKFGSHSHEICDRHEFQMTGTAKYLFQAL